MGKNVTHITDNGLFSHGKMGKGYEKVVLLKQYRNIFQNVKRNPNGCVLTVTNSKNSDTKFEPT